jgi:uncharacterized membrane protein
MTTDFPPNAEKIVNDYLVRMSSRLRGIPDSDRNELIGEIRSHIYESYTSDAAPDEVERILSVLRRLGEPDEVISNRMPEAVKRLGKGKKAPLYIVAGILIALFGLPLGIGALALLMGLLVTLFGLLVTYYGTGITLVVGGFLTAVISGISILSPDLVAHINELAGTQVINLGLWNDPELGGYVALLLSFLLMGVGLLMLWSGKYLWRGWRFVFMLIISKTRSIFSRLAQSGAVVYKSA